MVFISINKVCYKKSYGLLKLKVKTEIIFASTQYYGSNFILLSIKLYTFELRTKTNRFFTTV